MRLLLDTKSTTIQCIKFNLCILLKALYARDESRVANIARGKAVTAIFVTRLSSRAVYILYKRSSSVLSVLLYFTLTKVSIKYVHAVLWSFNIFIKYVNSLAFYKYVYSSVL